MIFRAAMKFLKAHFTCNCGKVKLSIDSPDVLRFVCYCRDCRGYYQTLNSKAEIEHFDPAATLDPWGGVDWTQCYPNEIQVLQGEEYLTTRRLRHKSPMYRVFSTCCYTPIVSLGQGFGSALLNTHLLLDDASKLDVVYRIMGRQALKGHDVTIPCPKMSWSVP